MKEKEMQENNDIKILNKLYQCAEMGTIGIESVIDKAHQEEFRNTLHSQKEEYDKIGDQIVSILKKYGCEEKHIGTMAKKSSEMMSEMKTKIDDSDSQIAKMMMEGNNKGIIEVAKLKNEYEGTDEEIMELMEHFLKTEQHNLDEMKKYL
ncbi:MAG: DUF2383 domain-containing protein [Bacilli bacterium]|jgi:hypothetical protein|nr:DUF2383 domain-containing protein [Bacilli bacterium]